MATFYQEHQQVHHQVNSEQAYMGATAQPPGQSAERMIGELIHLIRSDPALATAVRDAVVTELERAEHAAHKGNTSALVTALRSAAELAPSAAAIVTGVTAIIAAIAQ